MRSINFSSSLKAKQQGVALFVALIMLLVLTIIGLSAAQRSNLQESMAANTHLQNMTFNAAESAIGGFLAEANTGNKTLPGHMIFTLRSDSVNNQCYDEAGVRSDCAGGAHLDGDKARAIVSKMSVSVFDPCNRLVCGSYSLGGGSGRDIGCRIFQVDATGAVAGTSVSHTLYAYEVSICN